MKKIQNGEMPKSKIDGESKSFFTGKNLFLGFIIFTLIVIIPSAFVWLRHLQALTTRQFCAMAVVK
jgi:hypothetical protein